MNIALVVKWPEYKGSSGYMHILTVQAFREKLNVINSCRIIPTEYSQDFSIT